MEFKDVTLDQVVTVYSGLPGCGCGCRGTYYVPVETDYSRSHYETVNPKMVKRVYNKFKKLGDLVKSHPGGDIFYYETEKRYYWLYLKGAK